MAGSDSRATWKGELTFALAPSEPVRVPSIFIGSQLVGLYSKPGRSICTCTCLSCKGTPLSWVGNGSLVTLTRAVCGLTLIAARTTTVAQVKRACDRGSDDRQAERRTMVGAGDVDLAFRWRDRFGTEAGLDAGVPDQAFRSTGTLGCLGFRAGRHRGEQRTDPCWQDRGHVLQGLVAVGTSDVHAERAERTGARARALRVETRRERQPTRRARPTTRTAVDRETRIGGHAPADRAIRRLRCRTMARTTLRWRRSRTTRVCSTIRVDRRTVPASVLQREPGACS